MSAFLARFFWYFLACGNALLATWIMYRGIERGIGPAAFISIYFALQAYACTRAAE